MSLSPYYMEIPWEFISHEWPFIRGTTRSLGDLRSSWLLATYKSWDDLPVFFAAPNFHRYVFPVLAWTVHPGALGRPFRDVMQAALSAPGGLENSNDLNEDVYQHLPRGAN